MKNLYILCSIFLLVILFSSCSKPSSPNPKPTAQDSLLTSFSIYFPQLHSKGVEVLGYDAQSQLATIHAYSYDSSSGAPIIDSFLISLTANIATNPPQTLDEVFHYQGDPLAGESEQHLLFYDGQNRLILDSITSGTTGDFSSQHYLYDNNGNTTVQWLFGDPQTPGSYAINQIDTIYVQNENILTDINYSETDGTLNHLFTRNYAAQINPLYNAVLANSLGCRMVFNNLFDFRSKNLPTQFIDQEYGIPTVTINYTWTADAAGRIVGGIGTDAGSGLAQQVYNFTY